MLKYAKEWQKKNKDKVNEYHRKYNKKTRTDENYGKKSSIKISEKCTRKNI